MKTATQIRTRRAWCKCSQMTLAKASGISRYTLSILENGHRKITNEESVRLQIAFSKLKKAVQK